MLQQVLYIKHQEYYYIHSVFNHYLDVIIDTRSRITSLIFFMLSLTLIAMSGPASISHNMYLHSIDSEEHSKGDHGLMKTMSVVLRVCFHPGKVAASPQGSPAS